MAMNKRLRVCQKTEIKHHKSTLKLKKIEVKDPMFYTDPMGQVIQVFTCCYTIFTGPGQ